MPVTNYYWDELSDNVFMEADENDDPTCAFGKRALAEEWRGRAIRRGPSLARRIAWGQGMA